MIRDATGVPPTRPTMPTASAQDDDNAPAARASSAVPVFNPRLRIDTELNLVVLEFRTGTGELRASIPSPRELDAYRRERDSAPPSSSLDVRR